MVNEAHRSRNRKHLVKFSMGTLGKGLSSHVIWNLRHMANVTYSGEDNE